MQRNVWIAIAVLALAAAGFLGFRAYQLSQGNAEDAEHKAQMQRDLDAARANAQEAQRKADREAEARRLADLKAKEEAEAEARRLAQAESERQAQEQARKRAEDDATKAAAELERIRAERAQLAAEAQRLAELRARETADAQQKLAAAQRALEESERRKNDEIARQAAVIASYNRSPSSVDKTATDEQATRRNETRIIFPSDYKRANHYYLPLLPGPEKENK